MLLRRLLGLRGGRAAIVSLWREEGPGLPVPFPTQRLDGKRDLDALSAVPVMEPLHESVADGVLVVELAGPQVDGELDARAAEATEPYPGLEVGVTARNLAHHLPSDLDRDALHNLEVAVVDHADPPGDLQAAQR